MTENQMALSWRTILKMGVQMTQVAITPILTSPYWNILMLLVMKFKKKNIRKALVVDVPCVKNSKNLTINGYAAWEKCINHMG
jgi:hypothetical protein